MTTEEMQEEIEVLKAQVRRLQPDVPRFGPNDFKRRMLGLRTSDPGKALLTSGRQSLQTVTSTATRPDDPINGQLVHVEGDKTYIWVASSGGAGAWEAV